MDSHTGLLSASAKLNRVTVQLARDLDSHEFRQLAIIGDPMFTPLQSHYPADNVQQLMELHFFKEVLGWKQLASFVDAHHLTDEIPRPATVEGMRKLSHLYAPYLYIHFVCLHQSNSVYRLVVTRSDTWEDVFISEIEIRSALEETTMALLTLGAGMREGNRCTSSDDEGRYPLFDSLNVWLKRQP